MSSGNKRYSQGELVFAKVRGYSAWPARVEGVAGKASDPANVKYHIFFFGSYESAIVKSKDLFPFEEHRKDMGKIQKPATFRKGMDEIQKNPTLPADQFLERARMAIVPSTGTTVQLSEGQEGAASVSMAKAPLETLRVSLGGGKMDREPPQPTALKEVEDDDEKLSKGGEDPEEQERKLKWMQLELTLVRIDTFLKVKASRGGADVPAVLELLEELTLLTPEIEALMLMKNPGIVVTINKLQSYVGSLESWDLSEDDKNEFKAGAEQIRKKAAEILNYFEGFFYIPADMNMTFMPAFRNVVDVFRNRFSHLPDSEFMELTSVPVSNEEGEEEGEEEEVEGQEEGEEEGEEEEEEVEGQEEGEMEGEEEEEEGEKGEEEEEEGEKGEEEEDLSSSEEEDTEKQSNEDGTMTTEDEKDTETTMNVYEEDEEEEENAADQSMQ